MRDTTTREEHSGTAAFAEFTRQWVRDFAATATATEAELTALDQQVGDGDFGTNLVAGCQATLRLLTTEPAPGRPARGSAEGPAAGGAVRPTPDATAGPASRSAAAGRRGGPGAVAATNGDPARTSLDAAAGAAPAHAPDALAAKAGGMDRAALDGAPRHARDVRGTGRTALDPTPLAAASTPPGAAAAGPLEAAASAFLDEVGGTSGPLFGLLFQELAAALRSGAAADPTGALAAGVRGGLAAIQRVGEAEVGDKTLVDALAPAATVLAGSPRGAADPGRALADAARAAWQGVHDTARITARRGRASYLGDRAAGVPDPGAVGIALLFTAAAGPVTTLSPLLP